MKKFFTYFCVSLALLFFFTVRNLYAQAPGNALNFDGVDDFVDCGNSTSVQIGGYTITLEAWIKADSWRNNIWQGDIIAKDHVDANLGYMLRCGDEGGVDFNIGDGSSWYEVQANAHLKTGQWYHLAAVYDGAQMLIYIDGINVARRDYNGIIGSTGSGDLVIGSSPYYPERTFCGSIDEVRIWNIARSQDDILNHMNTELTGNESGLVAYYRFDQGTAGGNNTTVTTLPDVTPHGNNGTLNGHFALSGDTSNWVESYALVQPQADSASDITLTSFVAHWSAPLFGRTPAGYLLDIATDSLFTSYLTGYEKRDVGNITTDTIRGLYYRQTYYYRVRAYTSENIGNSQCSKTIPCTTLSLPFLSGTVYVGMGQTATSLTGDSGIFHSIYGGGLSGNLTIVITSDMNETGRWSLSRWLETGAGGYTVTIQPDGSTERLIAGNYSNDDGMIRFDGCSNVTINGSHNGVGSYLRFRNTSPTGAVFGIMNGVNTITLHHNYIEGSMEGEGALLQLDGSFAANENITIHDNMFSDRTDTTTTVGSAISAWGENGNNDLAIRDNEFVNFDDEAIWTEYTQGTNWNITGNSFYSTRALTYFSGLYIYFNSVSNDTIAYNYFGGQASHCGGNAMDVHGSFYGIYFYSSDSSNVVIDHNIIQNIHQQSFDTYTNFYGINTMRGTVTNNIIGHPTDGTRGIRLMSSGGNDLDGIESGGKTVSGNILANISMYGDTSSGGGGIVVDHVIARPKESRLRSDRISMGEKVPDGMNKSRLTQYRNRMRTTGARGNMDVSAPYFCGFVCWISGSEPQTINANKIYDIGISGFWEELGGFYLEGYGNTTLANNMVSFTPTDTQVTVQRCDGIYVYQEIEGESRLGIANVCSTNIYYNSVTMKAAFHSSSPYMSTCVYRDMNDSSVLTVKNNIFENRNQGEGIHTALTVGHPQNFICDYNDLYSIYKDTVCSYDNDTTVESLENWVSMTGLDVHSSSVGANFVDVTTGDLHLTGSSLGDTSLAGTPIPGITIDIDNDLRDPSIPYMGADENTSRPIGKPVPIEYAMKDKWNMISVPMSVSNYSKTALYPTSVSNAFAYMGAYSGQATLANGVGYWLKFNGNQGVTITGIPITTLMVTVNAGWNMIGTIGTPVDVHNISAITSGLELSTFYGYAGGYVPAETLKPALGYWVKANKAGQFVLTSITSKQSKLGKIKFKEATELPPAPPMDNTTETSLPTTYTLSQNYPNPFNPSTVIAYTLPADVQVTLKVYNTLGQEVATLINGEQQAGYKSIAWDAGSCPSGVYFYKLTAGGFTDVKKLMIVK